MLPTHVFLGSKREMSRGKKKKLSIQETGKCMQINRSIFNPETFFHSSIFKQKCKPRSLSPAQGKNSSSMRKSPSSQRVYRRRQSVSEGAGCDEAEGDSTYLQKSHNICSYRSRWTKSRPARTAEDEVKAGVELPSRTQVGTSGWNKRSRRWRRRRRGKRWRRRRRGKGWRVCTACWTGMVEVATWIVGCWWLKFMLNNIICYNQMSKKDAETLKLERIFQSHSLDNLIFGSRSRSRCTKN